MLRTYDVLPDLAPRSFVVLVLLVVYITFINNNTFTTLVKYESRKIAIITYGNHITNDLRSKPATYIISVETCT